MVPWIILLAANCFALGAHAANSAPWQAFAVNGIALVVCVGFIAVHLNAKKEIK